jgi:HSP20 family molecular chaperone IbpA
MMFAYTKCKHGIPIANIFKGDHRMFPFNSFFPFKDGIQQWLKQSDHSASIEKYVQETISKTLENSMKMLQQNAEMMNGFFGEARSNPFKGQTSTSAVQSDSLKNQFDIFESHEDVYVKIQVPDAGKLQHIKIFHTSNQVIVEGYPNEDSRHVIALPAIVRKKGASTSYKDGFLQIKLPKGIDMQYTEIDVPTVE